MQKQGVTRLNLGLLKKVQEIAMERGYTTSHVVDFMLCSYLENVGDNVPLIMPKVVKKWNQR